MYAVSAPTSLSASPASTQVTLTWSGGSGSTYHIYRSTVSGGSYSSVGSSTASPWTDISLTNGTTFYYVVRGFSSGATPPESGNSTQASATPQLPAPTGFTAIPGNAQTSLSWNAVSGATSYKLYRSTTTGGEGTTAVASGITITSYTNTSLTNGTTYYYKVASVDATTTSAQSSEASATPVMPMPGVPMGLAATPSNQSISLTWTAGSNAASYNIYRGAVAGGEAAMPIATSVSTTSYQDTGLTNGAAYYYKVASVNATGTSAQSSEANATANLQGPSGLTALASGSQIVLSWSAPAGATSYNVYRGTAANGEGASPINVSAIFGTTYNDSMAAYSMTACSTPFYSTVYYYKIKGVNSTGMGLASSETHSVTIAPPTWVRGYQVSTGFQTGPNLIDLSALETTTGYPDASPDGTGVTARYVLGYSPQRAVKTIKIAGALSTSGGSYVVDYSSDGATWTQASSGSGTQPTSGLPSFQNTVTLGTSVTAQYWRVSIKNPVVETPCALTDFRLYDQNGDPMSAPSPLAPTSLAATYGNRQVALSWSPGVGNFTYNILRGTTSGGESVTPIATGVFATTYTDLGLSNCSTYYYVVTSSNQAWTSPESNEVSTSPQLTAPANVTAIAISAYNIKITWSAVANAGSYKVYRSTASSGPFTTAIQTVSGTECTDSSIEHSTQYWYKVSAVDSAVTSCEGPLSDAAPIESPEFLISANANDFAVPAGAGFDSILTITPFTGYTGNVNFSASSVSGLTTSFAPPTNAEALDVMHVAGLSSGTYSFYLSGWTDDDGYTMPINVKVTSNPDFQLTVSPDSLTTPTAKSISLTAAVTPINGFTGSVDVTVSGLPTGTSALPSTQTLTVSGTSAVLGTRVINCGSVAAKPYLLTITGVAQGGGPTHTTQCVLNVVASDFLVNTDENTLSCAPGGAATALVVLTPAGGFSGNITCSAPNLPSGVTASFGTQPVALSGVTGTSLLMNLSVSSVVVAGVYPIIVNAQSDAGFVHSVVFMLNVSSSADFSLLAGGPVSALIPAADLGGPVDIPVSVTAVNDFTGSAALSVTGLPSGMSVSWSPSASASPGTNATLALTQDGTPKGGIYNVQIQAAASAGRRHTATVTAVVSSDFRLSAAASSLTIIAAPAGPYSALTTVSITPYNGFNGNVGLTTSCATSGITAACSPSTVGIDAYGAYPPASFTIFVAGTVAPGTYTVTLTGTSGTLTHAISLTVTVPPPDFTLSLSPGSLTVPAGIGGRYSLTVNPLYGFTGVVSVSASCPASGVTADVTPSTVAAGNSAGVAVAVADTVSTGSYTVTATGTASSLTRSATATVVVPAPDYALIVSPTSVTAQAGGGATAMVLVRPLNGFTGTVDGITVTSSNTSIVCTLGTTSLAAGSGTTLSMNVAAGTSPGSYTVTVSAGSHGAPVTLVVTGTDLGSGSTSGSFDFSFDDLDDDVHPWYPYYTHRVVITRSGGFSVPIDFTVVGALVHTGEVFLTSSFQVTANEIFLLRCPSSYGDFTVTGTAGGTVITHTAHLSH